MRTRGWFLLLVSILALGAVMAPLADAKKKPKRAKPPREPKPLVIGHRGASGFVPEHTLQSYRLAIKLGADYVEPDLVMTKDHVLVARHEPFIGTTKTDDRDSTNVADHHEFDGKIKTRILDGDSIEGWWVADFTLAELKTLGAKQTRGSRPTQFDGLFKIPTLQEIINLVKRESKKRGRRIGIYPETKHPTFHDDLGLSLEEPLVKTLKKNGLNSKNSPVFIQSFEQSNLQQLNHMTRVRLIQLIDAYDTDANGNPIFLPPNDRPYDWNRQTPPRNGPNDTFGYLTTNAGLDEVKAYADGIGPWKVYIIPSNPDGVLFPHTDLIDRAHARGLKVHTWTFRDDSFPSGYPGGPVDEYLDFYELGIDGVFSDFPDTAFAAREIFRGL